MSQKCGDKLRISGPNARAVLAFLMMLWLSSVAGYFRKCSQLVMAVSEGRSQRTYEQLVSWNGLHQIERCFSHLVEPSDHQRL